METIMLTGFDFWPENEYEGSAYFNFHGREIEARGILSGHAEWKTWGYGRVIRAEIFLLRIGSITKAARPAEFVRVGRASYEATGRVTAIVDQERVVLDVGFPLVLDLDFSEPQRALLPEVGDEISIYGEMQIEQVDED